MKGKTVIGLLVIVGMLVVGTVYAFGYRGSSGINTCQDIDIEKVKQFQKETLSLRDELMTKRIELWKECRQPEPDSDRINTLKKEIRDLRASIQEASKKYDVDLGCLKRHHKAGRKGCVAGRYR